MLSSSATFLRHSACQARCAGGVFKADAAEKHAAAEALAGPGEHRERYLRDHPQRHGPLLAPAGTYRGVNYGTYMGAKLAHRRGAQANLASAAREAPTYGREQEPAADARSHHPSHSDFVDRDLAGHAFGYPGDVPVALELSNEYGRPPVVGTEAELEGVAVQPGRGCQVRKAGTEDPCPAQGHDRQYRT